MPIITQVEQVNGQAVTATNTMRCDRPGCKSEIVWNAMPGPTDQLPHKLDDIIEVASPKFQKKLVLCSTECAILTLNSGLLLPPKVTLASSDEAKAAVAGASKVREMKVKR